MSRVFPRSGNVWRVSKRCPCCLCPFLIVTNICFNVWVMPSSVCYRIGLLIAFNFFLVSYNKLALLSPLRQSIFVSFAATCVAKFYFPGASWFIFQFLGAANYLLHFCSESLVQQFKGSFSPCEFLIVSQGIFTCLVQSTLCEFSSIVPGLALSCSNDPTTRILQLLFLGLSITVITMSIAASNRNLILVYSFFFFGLLLMYSRIAVILKQEPLTWLFFDVLFTSSRIHIFELWACLFLLTIFFCVVVDAFASRTSNTVIRKFFHLIVIPVYATGLKNDPAMLHFLSSCLLWILIVLETLRITDPDNVGKAIEFFMERFKNENDRGTITLTHIYLLVGLSLSIWISPDIEKISFNLTSGMITVAVGDTAAAIVGSLCGRHKWPNSKKSIEGTLGAIFFQILASVLLQIYLEVQTNIIVVIILSFILSILEAKTIQIDNLLLPLYFNLLWLISAAI